MVTLKVSNYIIKFDKNSNISNKINKNNNFNKNNFNNFSEYNNDNKNSISGNYSNKKDVDKKIKIYVIILIFNLLLIIIYPFYGFLASLIIFFLSYILKYLKNNKNDNHYNEIDGILKKYLILSLYIFVFYYVLFGKSMFVYLYRLLGYVLITFWFLKFVNIYDLIDFIGYYNKDLKLTLLIVLSTLTKGREKYRWIKYSQESRCLNNKTLKGKIKGYFSLIIPLVVNLYERAIKLMYSLYGRCYK